MNATGSAGNHFRIRTPGWHPDDDKKGSEQVFLNNIIQTGKGLDITSFPGGTLYIGGYGAVPKELPDSADAVEAQPREINAMVNLVKQYTKVPSDQELEILEPGRCYRPLAIPNHPIITKVDWSLLGIHSSTMITTQLKHPGSPSERPALSCPSTIGGIFVNTGHHSDGMTLSLGSGRVMSELLFGLPPSVNISGLGIEMISSPFKSLL